MFKKIIYCALFAIGLWIDMIVTEIVMEWLVVNHYITPTVWRIEEPIMELALVGWWIYFAGTTFSKEFNAKKNNQQ